MSLLTSFPSITGDPLKFNPKQFIADLANAAGNPSFDGLVLDNKTDLSDVGGPIVGGYNDLLNGNLIDNTNKKSYPFNPANYAGVGDPRFTTDRALKAVFDEFLPRQQAYSEIANAGGCQVINGYICNEDGVPVAKASSTCTSAVNVERITGQEVETFIRNAYTTAFKNESDSFINEIRENYLKNNWTVDLFDLFFVKTFIVRFKKLNTNNVYVKYFYDQKDYVSKALNIPLVSLDLGDELLGPNEDGAAFIKVIQAGAPVYNTN
jgi:hypothetical protein